jgi:hypothetical protein
MDPNHRILKGLKMVMRAVSLAGELQMGAGLSLGWYPPVTLG